MQKVINTTINNKAIRVTLKPGKTLGDKFKKFIASGLDKGFMYGYLPEGSDGISAGKWGRHKVFDTYEDFIDYGNEMDRA